MALCNTRTNTIVLLPKQFQSRWGPEIYAKKRIESYRLATTRIKYHLIKPAMPSRIRRDLTYINGSKLNKPYKRNDVLIKNVQRDR